jgi:hypothetical protein
MDEMDMAFVSFPLNIEKYFSTRATFASKFIIFTLGKRIQGKSAMQTSPAVPASIPNPLAYEIPPGEENDPFWLPANQEALRRAIANVKAGKYTIHDLIEVGDD